MKWDLRALAAAGAFVTALAAPNASFAQKQGGILRMYSPDSPASMSIHEGSTSGWFCSLFSMRLV